MNHKWIYEREFSTIISIGITANENRKYMIFIFNALSVRIKWFRSITANSIAPLLFLILNRFQMISFLYFFFFLCRFFFVFFKWLLCSYFYSFCAECHTMHWKWIKVTMLLLALWFFFFCFFSFFCIYSTSDIWIIAKFYLIFDLFAEDNSFIFLFLSNAKQIVNFIEKI